MSSMKRKAVICKQANKYTTLGKCYLVDLKIDSNGYRSVSITLDNGVTGVINELGDFCSGGFNGVAKFDVIQVSKECYLGQPALTTIENKAIGTLAALNVLNANPEVVEKIKNALDCGKDLGFVEAYYWPMIQTVLRDCRKQNAWLAEALKIAADFMNKSEKLNEKEKPALFKGYDCENVIHYSFNCTGGIVRR